MPITDPPNQSVEGPIEPDNPLFPRIEVRLNSASGEILTDGGFHSVGSFVQNTDTSITLYVKNVGDTGSVLTIPQNGISIETGGSAVINSNPSSSGALNIVQGSSGISFTVKFDTTVVGNKSFEVSVLSSDDSTPKHNHTFFFTVTSPSTLVPDIAVVYNGSQVQNDSVVSLGSYPKEGITDISFSIFNYATPNLIISQNGIDLTLITGNELLTTDPTASSSVTLGFNASTSFAIRLDTADLGNKSVIVTITSNDSDENPFIFTITYTVAKAFDLIVQESSEEVAEDETVNLGSFNKRTIINRNISVSNRGISYGIRLLSISSDGEVSLIGVPSLPYVLQPNERNIVEFVARFGSATLGRKNASLRIQWEVSA